MQNFIQKYIWVWHIVVMLAFLYAVCLAMTGFRFGLAAIITVETIALMFGTAKLLLWNSNKWLEENDEYAKV